MNKSQSVGMYVVLGIMVLAFISMLFAGPTSQTTELTYTTVIQKLNAGEIKSVQIDGNSLVATPIKQPEQPKKSSAEAFFGTQNSTPKVQYHVLIPNTSALMPKLEQANVDISVKKPSESSQMLGILGSLVLPLLFIIFLVVMAKSIQAHTDFAVGFQQQLEG